jgi:hypothetical protein
MIARGMPTMRRPALDLGGPRTSSPVDRSANAARIRTEGLHFHDLRHTGMRRSGLGYTVCPAARNDQVNDSHDRHEQT